jgi:hypothetical protein
MATPIVLPEDPENDELRGPINSLGRLASRVGIPEKHPGAGARDPNGGPVLVERPLRSAEEAVERLRATAAQGGHPSAFWLLGEALEAGEGVARDLREAERCYVKAADAGSEPAAAALRRLGSRWRPKRRPEEPVAAEEPLPPRYVKPPFADAFVPGMEYMGSKRLGGDDGDDKNAYR